MLLEAIILFKFSNFLRVFFIDIFNERKEL